MSTVLSEVTFVLIGCRVVETKPFALHGATGGEWKHFTGDLRDLLETLLARADGLVRGTRHLSPGLHLDFFKFSSATTAKLF